MLTQRTELATQLLENGWQVISVEDYGLEWWADEIWLIESLWSPKGFRLYLTFLVDPMAGGQRTKGQSVWAMGTSIGRPVDRSSAQGNPLLSLGRGWRSHLAEFFAGLSGLRSQAAADALPARGEI
ncbi:MAG: hypothetical protein LC795_06075 [Acidobacteria bacterium]|nr:hypothetical protein [Acidobacteriota bacterium]